MFEINDKFYLGAISGIIANIVSNILGWTLYLFNINKFTMWHISGSAFFPKKSFHRITPLLIGAISDYTVAISFGLIVVYLLYFTGLEHPIFKGIVLSMIYWLIFYGIIVGTEITKINPTSIATNISHFFNHILIGVLTPLIIIKYGQKIISK